jgi:peptidyl-prolyl cis-trans isomerase C
MDWNLPRMRHCALLLASAFCLSSVAGASDAPDAATVLARQAGAVVTMGDVDAFAERIPAERRTPFFNSQQRIAMTINTILLQKQLAAIARTQGLDKAAEKPMSDQELAEAEVEHFKATLNVPDLGELARERYVANPEKYDVPETLDVQHVLITSTTRSEEEAKALAATIEAEARKNPSDFDALVEKYSDDADKSKSHGLVKNAGGHRVKGFAEAAQALAKPGDISPVVETSVGYQVLKLVAKEPKRRKSFEEVRDQTLETMKQEFVARAVQNQADQLRNQPIDVNSDLADSLLKRYAATSAEKPAPPKPAGAAMAR